ncbi:MAG: FtsH protease activity modulator HflK [Blautia sp.]|nr:FtsH protease activity modulator HflK [Blautia sp.]
MEDKKPEDSGGNDRGSNAANGSGTPGTSGNPSGGSGSPGTNGSPAGGSGNPGTDGGPSNGSGNPGNTGWPPKGQGWTGGFFNQQKKPHNNGPIKFPKKPGSTKNLKKNAGIAAAAVLLVIACAVVSGSFYRVDEQEAAVVTMFGKHVRTDTAGLYFKIPLLQKVEKVDTTIHGTGIGYAVNNDGQNFTVDTEGIMITSDFNLIDIDFYMEYRVSDPVAYLYNSAEPEMILKNMALAAIRSTVIDFTVDDAITVGKSQIQTQVKQKLQEALTDDNIGLQIVNITVQDAEPPTSDIVGAFKAVETAKQGKDTAVNNAKQYQNEQIPAAEASADKIIQNAEGKKQARIAEAEGQVARFNAMYEQYSLNPLITKQRMFYEAMEEVLPNARIIISDGSTQTMYPIESFSGTPAVQSGKEDDPS